MFVIYWISSVQLFLDALKFFRTSKETKSDSKIYNRNDSFLKYVINNLKLILYTYQSTYKNLLIFYSYKTYLYDFLNLHNFLHIMLFSHFFFKLFNKVCLIIKTSKRHCKYLSHMLNANTTLLFNMPHPTYAQRKQKDNLDVFSTVLFTVHKTWSI